MMLGVALSTVGASSSGVGLALGLEVGLVEVGLGLGLGLEVGLVKNLISFEELVAVVQAKGGGTRGTSVSHYYRFVIAAHWKNSEDLQRTAKNNEE